MITKLYLEYIEEYDVVLDTSRLFQCPPSLAHVYDYVLVMGTSKYKNMSKGVHVRIVNATRYMICRSITYLYFFIVNAALFTVVTCLYHDFISSCNIFWN